MQHREDRLQKIREHPEVSVLIVGAGINGIGTFRDLALQGVDVVLIDRSDYCSGASAASSHMVHGGIRYLENGEFRLVREAVRERNRLIENAPHLVKPLPTTFPIFKWFSGLWNAPLKFFGLLEKPSERGAIVIKIGMLLYDYFTRKQKTVPKHVFRSRNESLRQFPSLNEEIVFTATYYDGAMPSPERIAIELLLDAVKANDQAVPLNYVSLLSAEGNTVTLRNEVHGDTFELKPKIVINAGGPWIDFVNNSFNRSTEFISATKGSHLILEHPELSQAIKGHEFFFENQDGRIVLIFPIQDKVMIGTSDIRIDDPDDAVITKNEVDYFFDLVRRVFPNIKVDRQHIIYTFSGVRPLQRTEGSTTGQISRDHKVRVNEANGSIQFPVLSLVGGKWTSFRAFSEQAADMVLKRLGLSRKINTGNLQIGGSLGYPQSAKDKEAYFEKILASCAVEKTRLEQIFQQYGTNAESLLQIHGSEMSKMLRTLPTISVGEIKKILINEDVVHLDDLILRRTMLGKLGQIAPESLEEISAICARVLNWTEEKSNQEKVRFMDLLKLNHKMKYNSFIED